MTDHRTAQAITDAEKALTHRVRDRDQTPEHEQASPEEFAAEYVQTLRNEGWRLTEARAQQAWQREQRQAVPPDANPEWQALRARQRGETHEEEEP